MAGAWSDLHGKIHTQLRQTQFLPHQARLLIAVSGGQDSIFLLRLLLDLQRLWAWELQVIHCNHGWRADANLNAEFVQALSHEAKIPCHIETATEHLKNENQARAWRYQVFAQVAQKLNITHVVTGHTATDQAETLLLHLIRGSGLTGLGGMAWSRELSPELAKVKLVRPLLGITREQTLAFCQEQGLEIWLDSTNENLDLRRNRMRLEMMPLIKEHFNPQAEMVLAQTAQLCQAESDFLAQEAQKLYAAVVNLELPGLDQSQLQQVHPALQRRLIRQFLQGFFEISPTFEHIEVVMRLISAPKNSQSESLPQHIQAWVEPPWLRFRRVEPI